VYPHHLALPIATEQWDWAMRVNVRDPYLTIKRAAPHMIRQRSGNIINITSGSAEAHRKDDLAHRDLAAYGVTKAALTRSQL
jgi:NAD(P)-dependent dehydrogenase (short-subunit alcohol dehydrogenase family)